jgi:hypothetical protein
VFSEVKTIERQYLYNEVSYSNVMAGLLVVIHKHDDGVKNHHAQSLVVSRNIPVHTWLKMENLISFSICTLMPETSMMMLLFSVTVRMSSLQLVLVVSRVSRNLCRVSRICPRYEQAASFLIA